MFGNPVSSSLSFTKIISGLSKTLNIANQVIPIYREAKPMIQNAKNILSVFKGMNSNTNLNKTIKKEEIYPSKSKIINGPNFFL